MTRTILVLSVAAMGFGQDLPTFHANTRLVEVDVVVRDKNGPVEGLRKDDFSIIDNGKQQRVAAFSVFKSGSSSEKKASLPPGVVSNRLNSRGEEPAGATIFLWDAFNTRAEDQANVRRQMLEYLALQKAGDRIALYGLGQTLRVLQDFTDDPDRLTHTVSQTAPEPSKAAASIDLANDLAKFSQAAAAELAGFTQRERAYITTAAFRAIAQHLKGLPGRKKLLWFSGGFPEIVHSAHETLIFEPEVQEAIGALNDANIAVYPIDARGLVPRVSARADFGGLTLTNLDTINALAGGTGGRATYADNDFAGAIRSAMEDDAVTYRLGFYPTDKTLDRSEHKLVIQVSRHSGDDVRYRRSYYALDATNAVSGQWRDVLNETMQISLEATQVGLRGSVSPVEGEAGAYSLEVNVDLADLHLEKVKDRWVGVIDYALMFSPSDSMKGSLETVQINLTDERLKAAAQDGFVFRRKLTIGDKVGQVRVVIEDRATAAVGSVTVAIGR